MIPRRFVLPLVVGLPVLVTTFAVLMAGRLLAESIGDSPAAQVFRGVGLGCLALFFVDLILLVGALGANSLTRVDRPLDGAERGCEGRRRTDGRADGRTDSRADG